MWNKHLSRIPNRDQLSILIGVILLGLATTQFVQLPSRELGTTVLGSALGINISGYWMIITVLVVVACAGTDMLIRAHPRLTDGRLSATFITWILPGLTVLTAGRLLAAAPSWLLWWISLVVTGAIFGAVVTAEYALVDEKQPASSRARLLLNIIAYVLALILYTTIYQTRSRSLITTSATLLLSFLIALDLLWVARASLLKTIWLAGVVALIVAECSWAINYWQANVGTASLLLLLTFYATSGLTAQYLLGKLSRHIFIEFAAVIVVGAGLLVAFRP